MVFSFDVLLELLYGIAETNVWEVSTPKFYSYPKESDV